MNEAGSDAMFGAGESGDQAMANPIETVGARYGIREMSVHGGSRGAHEDQVSKFMMQSVTYRNGGTERVADAIGQTPLGGLMPGPNAIAPAIVVGSGYGPISEASDETSFKSGITDGWPEGYPVPVR
jgi:hypothetical protein